jgi:hypothetical protein
MKRELQGILTRSGDQPSIKTANGKTRLIFNMFDGLTGRKVKITVEELEEEE